MNCPKCSGPSFVYGGANFGIGKERYRACRSCDHRWKTWEEPTGIAVKPVVAVLRKMKASAAPVEGAALATVEG